MKRLVWQNLSLLFDAIDSEKHLGYAICQSGTTHSGSVYSASWGKSCAGGTILPSGEHNWLKWSCDKYDTQTDNWLVFKSLRLGFRISLMSRFIGPCFRFGDSAFRVRVYPTAHVIGLVYKQEAANCLPALKPWQHLSMHGTELLHMSWSTKQDMYSKLVMWLLQPIVFS